MTGKAITAGARIRTGLGSGEKFAARSRLESGVRSSENTLHGEVSRELDLLYTYKYIVLP